MFDATPQDVSEPTDVALLPGVQLSCTRDAVLTQLLLLPSLLQIEDVRRLTQGTAAPLSQLAELQQSEAIQQVRGLCFTRGGSAARYAVLCFADGGVLWVFAAWMLCRCSR
jgi:hypothetical protein